MFPYWLLFSMCVAGAVQHKPDWRRPAQGGILLIAGCIVILLMIGLRYEVGGDWAHYMRTFDYIAYLKLGDAIFMSDPGYAVLNWLSSRIGLGMWFVNSVCAVIFMWGLTKFVRRQPNPWLALVVAVPYLVIVVSMGYTRQAVAIGLILAGISQLKDFPSIIRFGFYVVLAATFHKSAIVVLPLVAFSATTNRYISLGIGFVLGLMLYYLFVQANIDRMVYNYEVAGYDSQGALVRVAQNVVPAALFLLFRSRFGFDSFNKKLWRNFSLAAFGALAMLAIIESSTMVDRLALYLLPLQVTILSRAPHAFSRDGSANGLVTLMVIAYAGLIQFVWLNFATHAVLWLPYKVYPFLLS